MMNDEWRRMSGVKGKAKMKKQIHNILPIPLHHFLSHSSFCIHRSSFSSLFIIRHSSFVI